MLERFWNKLFRNMLEKWIYFRMVFLDYIFQCFGFWIFGSRRTPLGNILHFTHTCLSVLGILQLLKYLKIKGPDKMAHICSKFDRNNSSSFKSLEIVYFSNMEKWEGWVCKANFSCLYNLSLEWCVELKGLPKQLLHVKDVLLPVCKGSRYW